MSVQHAGRVVISTHDLQRAGQLRAAFRDAAFKVELVTPDEDLRGRDDILLVVLTLPGPGETGLHLLREALTLEVPVVGFGPDGFGELAEVFSQHASPDEVVLVCRRLLDRRHLQDITGIVGETDAMREVLERVVQFAPVASTVLVTGESGTGKELVARGIHQLSPRRHKPFIAVNVAALPDTLLESELFGHEKGAFTGAIDARRGLFELADGGTIFLDEIGEMPLSTQTKLLRVLEQREFLRVGGERPISVDVRIVAATNQELRQLVTLREFRKDLYYRLNVLHIELPSLRERPADIPLLVRRFSREIADRLGRDFAGLDDDAMDVLMRHSWPGNVRELRNLIESMVVLASGRRIRPQDIPDSIGAERGHELLPAPIPRAGAGSGGDDSLRPQLEFVFRTLVDLRVDIDDLRKEFEVYRRQAPELGEGESRRREVGWRPRAELPAPASSAVSPTRDDLEEFVDAEVVEYDRDDSRESGVVVYRPGMTIDDMEREAIRLALDSVDGNRRRAAELLGIGERTLYRKIKQFGLET
jgi:DNA-binding NtrC family response regulator